MIARYQNLYFSTNGVNFFSNFRKIKVFWFLLFLSEYAMNQKKFGSFVICLISTNFGEVRSKFSHNSRTLINMLTFAEKIKKICLNLRKKNFGKYFAKFFWNILQKVFQPWGIFILICESVRWSIDICLQNFSKFFFKV